MFSGCSIASFAHSLRMLNLIVARFHGAGGPEEKAGRWLLILAGALVSRSFFTKVFPPRSWLAALVQTARLKRSRGGLKLSLPRSVRLSISNKSSRREVLLRQPSRDQNSSRPESNG